MRFAPSDPVRDLHELRRLLFDREQRRLRELRERIVNEEQRTADVAAVLPDALKLAREQSDDELARALRPTVEGSMRESIEQHPQVFVDLMHPIVGPMVRRSIAETLRRLLQSFNQTLEHTFSWRGLKWRLEALRTGRSFAEVVLLRSLVYRVEQIFLIHRETSLPLLHVAANDSLAEDSTMVAGMLSAIQDFARDSFKSADDAALEEFRVGDLQVWIVPGRYAFLAAVIRGDPPRELRTELEEAIESIHRLAGSRLAAFSGDSSAFESLRPELENCLRSQQLRDTSKGPRTAKARLALALLGALMLAAILVGVRTELRFRRFVNRLRAEPGIVVTSASKGWLGASRISGLRDPLAPDPAQLARDNGIRNVQFEWKDYLGIDPQIALARFTKILSPPSGVSAQVVGGTLVLSGDAPYDWVARVREAAPRVPGVSAVSEKDLHVGYDSAGVVARFRERLAPPDSVRAIWNDKRIVLAGSASHAWLQRAKAEATQIVGIEEIDARGVVDLDEREFTQTKSVIESAFVYFLLNKDNFASEGFAALSRLPDVIRRCLTAGHNLGLQPVIEIRGAADAVGTEALNAELSRRRAAAVRDFLISCGIEPDVLKPIALGAPSGTPARPEDSERRVSFRVVVEPAAQ